MSEVQPDFSAAEAAGEYIEGVEDAHIGYLSTIAARLRRWATRNTDNDGAQVMYRKANRKLVNEEYRVSVPDWSDWEDTDWWE